MRIISQSLGERKALFVRLPRACDLCRKSALVHADSSRLRWLGLQWGGSELHYLTTFQGRALLFKTCHSNLPCLACGSVGEGRCRGSRSAREGRAMCRRTGVSVVQSHIDCGRLHYHCWNPCGRCVLHPAGRPFPPPPVPPLGMNPCRHPGPRVWDRGSDHKARLPSFTVSTCFSSFNQLFCFLSQEDVCPVFEPRMDVSGAGSHSPGEWTC